ncbi:MAG: hypothetical protein U1F58_11960 [Burkholderiales bacterium]
MSTITHSSRRATGTGTSAEPAAPAASKRSAWARCARLVGVAAFAALAAGPSLAAAGDDGFVTAMRAYEEGRYAFAYGRLVLLADAGHAEAARIALLMLRYGPQLYGSQWSAAPNQIEHWLALAGTPSPTLVAERGE